MTPILQSTLTCPHCATQTVETMPTHVCVYFHTCPGCGTVLKPRHGDCCVFCSYGSVPCPPTQEGGGTACCGTTAEGAVPAFCSLEPTAFRDRIDEIAALMRRHGGRVQRTADGVELGFRAGEGLRGALDDLVEKERACCPTLRFTVAAHAELVVLRIDGPAETRTAVDDLVTRLGIAISPAAELRINVHRPDWSRISLPRAREVLRRRVACHGDGVARWNGLDAAEDDTLRAILHHFVKRGGVPSDREVAYAAGLSPDQARQALERLHKRDLIVLDQSSGSIVAAYPFTSRATGHRVTLLGRTIDSLCAIDALGAGAMFATNSEIASSCAQCGTPVQLATSGNGSGLRSVAPAGAVVWYTLAFDGSAAKSCCPSTVFFCSDDHLSAWVEARGARSDGDRLDIAEALEIGTALFEPLLRRLG